MPVRKPKKNYRSLTGMFYSLKNGKGIFFESKLERDLFLTLEFDKNVISYEEQPMTLSYKKGTRTYPYTPDCLITYHEGLPCVVEVKYSDEIEEKKEEFEFKFNQISKTLHKKEFTFKMFTEMELNEVAIENMNFIYNYVTIRDYNMVEDIYQRVLSIGSLCYHDLLSMLTQDKYTQALYSPYIWYLVLIGKLHIDIDEKITPQTYIRVSL